MSWVYLFAAGVFEIGFTTFLKLSDNFSKLWPTIGFLVFSIASFLFLAKAMNTIPLGTAYAVWTGIGAFGTAIIGIYFFNDPLNLLRVVFLTLLLVSVVGLKLVSH
jgi:quaternary ammonium compound-resistance protein SugE